MPHPLPGSKAEPSSTRRGGRSRKKATTRESSEERPLLQEFQSRAANARRRNPERPHNRLDDSFAEGTSERVVPWVNFGVNPLEINPHMPSEYMPESIPPSEKRKQSVEPSTAEAPGPIRAPEAPDQQKQAIRSPAKQDIYANCQWDNEYAEWKAQLDRAEAAEEVIRSCYPDEADLPFGGWKTAHTRALLRDGLESARAVRAVPVAGGTTETSRVDDIEEKLPFIHPRPTGWLPPHFEARRLHTELLVATRESYYGIDSD